MFSEILAATLAAKEERDAKQAELAKEQAKTPPPFPKEPDDPAYRAACFEIYEFTSWNAEGIESKQRIRVPEFDQSELTKKRRSELAKIGGKVVQKTRPTMAEIEKSHPAYAKALKEHKALVNQNRKALKEASDAFDEASLECFLCESYVDTIANDYMAACSLAIRKAWLDGGKKKAIGALQKQCLQEACAAHELEFKASLGAYDLDELRKLHTHLCGGSIDELIPSKKEHDKWEMWRRSDGQNQGRVKSFVKTCVELGLGGCQMVSLAARAHDGEDLEEIFAAMRASNTPA